MMAPSKKLRGLFFFVSNLSQRPRQLAAPGNAPGALGIFTNVLPQSLSVLVPHQPGAARQGSRLSLQLAQQLVTSINSGQRVTSLAPLELTRTSVVCPDSQAKSKRGTFPPYLCS